MDKKDAVRHLRKRLIVLLAGLLFSYAISFGIAIFLAADAGVLDLPWIWAILAGFALLGLIHLRAQFRRYDALVRMVESSQDDA